MTPGGQVLGEGQLLPVDVVIVESVDNVAATGKTPGLVRLGHHITLWLAGRPLR